MKLSNMMEQERQSAYYNRKKILQRKEAGDAYRKNAQYFQPEKNPILLELENLLLGRQDQDLYEQHKEESKDVTPQQQALMQGLQQTEKSVRAHEHAFKTTGSDKGESPSSSRQKGTDTDQFMALEDLGGAEINTDTESADTLQILQQVRSEALTPTVPSPQDLRIAASADAQMQLIQADLNGTELDETLLKELEPSFVTETIDVKVPERFSKELNLDPLADTIFGKTYDETLKARTFKMASAKYVAHIQMAKSGYLYGDNSTFSMTA